MELQREIGRLDQYIAIHNPSEVSIEQTSLRSILGSGLQNRVSRLSAEQLFMLKQHRAQMRRVIKSDSHIVVVNYVLKGSTPPCKCCLPLLIDSVPLTDTDILCIWYIWVRAVAALKILAPTCRSLGMSVCNMYRLYQMFVIEHGIEPDINEIQLILQTQTALGRDSKEAVAFCNQHDVKQPITQAVNIADTELKENCPICLEPFIILHGDVCITSCGHYFHHECIRDWVANSGNETCPVCRTTVV